MGKEYSSLQHSSMRRVDCEAWTMLTKVAAWSRVWYMRFLPKWVCRKILCFRIMREQKRDHRRLLAEHERKVKQ